LILFSLLLLFVFRQLVKDRLDGKAYATQKKGTNLR